MAKRATRRKVQQAVPASAAERTDTFLEIARCAMLAGLVALLVATPLVPSEGAVDSGTGTVLVMLWLLLLVCWSGLTVFDRKSTICLCILDWVVIAFFGLVCLSSIVMMSSGYARATINMFWQWLSFGTCYILCRQMLRTPGNIRAASTVMVGLAVCLCTLAYYQYFYSLPEDRAAYARNPEAVLREAGIDAAEGSPERKLFEDRLESSEPSATFALANSLAGFLAPWLIVGLGIGIASFRSKQSLARVAVGAVFICLFVSCCLLLTKSRSAVLATTMGSGLFALWWWQSGRRIGWGTVLVGAGAVGALLGVVMMAGTLDRLVLTETPKSLLYRFQYWQATGSLIADHPWFGCGPGNFQQYYTAYKLPEASESISDPHNLLVEVWSNAGTPAAIAFVAILVLLAVRLFRRAKADRALEDDTATPDKEIPRGTLAVYAGAGLGVFLGIAAATVAGLRPDWALLWLAVPVAVIAMFILHAWCVRGRLGVPVAVVAFVVLTINLLAAGGISFAGVALTWWFLLAIVVNMTESNQEIRSLSRGAGIAMLLLAIVLAGACNVTMYQPVLHCQAAMADGLAAQQAGYPIQAEAAYRRAADADPYSAEPWLHLAALEFHMAQDHPAAFADFERSVQEVIDRKSKSHTIYRRLGGWRLAFFHRLGDREQLTAAVEAYENWVRLYPNSSLARAQLAWSHHLAGDQQAAASEAETALQLDNQNPHRERKLSEQRVFDPTGSLAESVDAEQLMFRLRR